MAEHDKLLTMVLNLVGRKTEGRYWDFKLQHHENNAELIHDVLCLANAEHTGQRYLIFGVDDKSFELRSVAGTAARKSQADIAGFFRDNGRKFFQSRTPEFYLSELLCGGKSLDVLVIEDNPHKPYHLIEDYPNGSKVVRDHHVYTRQNDTNTPMNGVAPPHEIERMWRERFGLDKTPLERATRHLDNPMKWVPVSERGFFGPTYYYHQTFPEFTIRTSEAEEIIARNEEWTRGEIRRDNNVARYLEMYYHQTLLTRAPVVTFDDGKKSMVAPKWEVRGAGRFYFYDGKSTEYALQRFLCQSPEGEDHSPSLSIGDQAGDELVARAGAFWPKGCIQIPVLRAEELESFIGPRTGRIEKHSTDDDEQYQIFVRNQIDFEEWRKNTGQR